MKTTLTAAVLAAMTMVALAAAPPRGANLQEELRRAQENTAQTYEHLASAIIELRRTENGLVKGIIMHSAGMADTHLARAARAEAGDKRQSLERAANSITEAANEGDKAVQAVRQRLSKAGHTHRTDVDTKQDYLWIDSKEKRQLLDLAQRVSKMDEQASAEEINKVRQELRSIMDNAMKDE